MNQSLACKLADRLGAILSKRKIRCTVAESCTGGSLAAVLTEIPGASNWFERGFVTYSNESKHQLLGVPFGLIKSHGAVSDKVARLMAEGAILQSEAQVSVAITGIAGPGGGSTEKPIGTVWISWAGDLVPTESHCYHFKGDRSSIRRQAVEEALRGLIRRCDPANHPQIQYKGTERYFFALWPGQDTAESIHKLSESLFNNSGDCTLVSREKLHLTLFYLGKVYPDFLHLAKQAASQLKVKPFTLQITSANHWPRSRVRWLGIESIPEEMRKMIASLQQKLLSLGFRPETKPFIPHVTIARQCSQKYPSEEVKQITWQVSELCLVRSSSTTGGSDYEIVARWLLTDGREK
ncbi:RNA 2',3'-cyclic phosphodiesterase [Legionella londiniensis]|uniref:RNA 2',3'-cyclic phosphodiesterase n=1 Tax=Legionella londiniensis TaxID=45068 RepID=A0A0W0VLQ9_9GAMM|nr:RNA 2',3'-cyclic phosphodiesterase [Legionella londiniensis]KTD21027.1 CinA-like competence damage protein [Legionella londiniensis]STX93698.1 putative 17.2kDa protein, CinA-related competence damage protein [Legionella londiniensis]